MLWDVCCGEEVCEVASLADRTHSGGIWLDCMIAIDANNIHAITGMPMDGEDVGGAFLARIVV